ncbi:MAG: TetR family transcriptional regulator [Ramlibacter sp.]|nr:TetR family transcriptional regulator [Ramlibacter sp.]
MGDANPPVGLPPLPPGLAAAFAAATSGGRGKRERTQSALVRAAVQVFCARGVAQATVQEVAQVAGMTAATVYNHFASKEALVAEVAVVLAQSLCRAIAQSHAAVADAAQRMAIGQRRYIWLAAQSPPWALLLLEMASASPGLLEYIQKYPLADLRAGLRQKRFTVPNEAVAMDAINGICTMAMRRGVRCRTAGWPWRGRHRRRPPNARGRRPRADQQRTVSALSDTEPAESLSRSSRAPTRPRRAGSVEHSRNPKGGP